MFLRCLLLAGLMMRVGAADAAPDGPDADMHLHTDLNRMSVQVDQGAPLPPGGCRAGHVWHTTYGGCRRQVMVTETAPCPPGHTGSRTRQRTDHILQADANNVVYDPLGSWQDTCQRPRLRGVVDEIVAMVRGNGGGVPKPVGERLGKNLVKQMRVGGYHSKFALTIDRPSAKLRCVYSRSTTSGNGESDSPEIWDGALLAPGQSVKADYVGHCLLSKDAMSASLSGNCDSLTGDQDYCTGATLTVGIIATTQCTVTTQIVRGTSGRRKVVKHYSLCD